VLILIYAQFSGDSISNDDRKLSEFLRDEGEVDPRTGHEDPYGK